MTLVKLFGALSHVSQWTVPVKSPKHLPWVALGFSLCPFMAFTLVSLNDSSVQNSAVQVAADKPMSWWHCQSIAQNTVHTLPVQALECLYEPCFYAFRY